MCTSFKSYDGIPQDELNWNADYCNEEFETIENSSLVLSYNKNITIVTEINCN